MKRVRISELKCEVSRIFLGTAIPQMLVVVSTTHPERVAENLAAFNLELDAPTRAWLNLEIGN